MDLGRVGIFGTSWGGYFALRGMLTAPEVFHVGVSSAPGELTEAGPINEPYMRLPENNPEGYAAGLNAPLASNLQGELPIIHGTADVNAPFSATMKMVAALIKAGKEHELVVVPEADHRFQGVVPGGRYITEYQRKFFQRHLTPEKEIFVEE